MRYCGKLRLAASLLIILSMPLWLGGCFLVEYTGALFSSGKTQKLCVELDRGITGADRNGVDITFSGTTLWGRVYQAKAITDAAGRACTLVKWPYDIYRMEPSGTSESDDGYGVPVALTTFNRDWAGVFAGGRIELYTEGVPPNVRPSEVRSATFGILNRTIEDRTNAVAGAHPAVMSPGRPARLLFLDLLNPDEPVEIAAQDYTLSLVFGGLGVGIDRISEVHLSGNCRLELGVSSIPAYFEALLAKGDSWDNPAFSIEVYRSGVLVYQASGDILDGGVMLKCTGGHGG